MSYIRYEVTIKYTRHPYLKDGSVDLSQTQTTTWFDTIYQESSRSLPETVAKAIAKRRFEEKTQHIKINSIRAVKQVYNDLKKVWK